MFERASGIGTVCTAEPTACDGTYSGASLDLYNKSLTGTIPPELAQLSNTLTDALCAAPSPGSSPEEPPRCMPHRTQRPAVLQGSETQQLERHGADRDLPANPAEQLDVPAAS